MTFSNLNSHCEYSWLCFTSINLSVTWFKYHCISWYFNFNQLTDSELNYKYCLVLFIFNYLLSFFLHFAGMDKMRERGAPLPGNNKENWGHHHVDVIWIWRGVLISRLYSQGRNHFIYTCQFVSNSLDTLLRISHNGQCTISGLARGALGKGEQIPVPLPQYSNNKKYYVNESKVLDIDPPPTKVHYWVPTPYHPNKIRKTKNKIFKNVYNCTSFTDNFTTTLWTNQPFF